jgi:putative ABC transport system permease protein
LFVFVLITLLIGCLTGVFPALAISSFRPVKLFRVDMSSSSNGLAVRKILMVSQFTVSIALTICTAITYKQVNYLHDAELGYDLDHTIVLNIGFKEVREKYATLKSLLMTNSSVIGATASSQLPTDIQTEENIDMTKSQSLGVNFISIDPDFFRVMKIPVKQGSDLISSITVSDTLNQFVLNESAVKSIGWNADDAVNKLMSIRHGNQHSGPVKGVVSDFHFQSLHHAVGPLVLEFDPNNYQYLLVRVKHENLKETIGFISKQWEAVAAGLPFDYMFLDQEYDNLYKSEKQTSSLFITFSTMAVVISLLGLFGLSSFAVERRTKEIGLRKILGANNTSILKLISKDFLFLIIISFVLAVPLGYYFMNSWLANFAFRTSIGPMLFLLAGSVNFLLGLFTLVYHSLRIAETNPIDTLRYE